MVTWNKTKIVATFGPACRNKSVLTNMLKSGVDVIRLNGAHANNKEHTENILLIRNVAKKLNLPIAILFDLPGPKLRLGELKSEPIKLKRNQNIILSCGKSHQTDERIPLPDKFLSKCIKKGDKVFINDGIVALIVKEKSGNDIHCKVVAGGEIRSRKGLNLPNTKLSIPALTKKDKELLNFAMKHNVDFIGLSFVRNSKNIKVLRNILKKNNKEIGIISKIEKPEALLDLDNIIKESDAIMVARGDLGIEMPFDQIPIIQKDILQKCLVMEKPTITATQMMESMVENSRPTRAEATDVAGAVWQGTDAVMLSEETSIGKNPTLVVKAMSKIVSQAEKQMPELNSPDRKKNIAELHAQLIGLSASLVAEEANAEAIVTPTRTGRTPLHISRSRPTAQIIAPTENEKIARKMNLLWGVRPMLMPTFKTVDELLNFAEKIALKSGYIKKGQTIVITSGAHGGKNDTTRFLEIRKI